MEDHNDQSPEEISSPSICPHRTCQNEKSDEEQNKTAGAGGGGGGSSSSPSISARKRGRTDAAHSGSSGGSGSGSKARKKGEPEVPSRELPTCYVCKKCFGSWKAVFGHLRAHRRQTPGAFPPPAFPPPKGSPERNDKGENAVKDQLLNLGRETMQKKSEYDSKSNSSVAAGDGSRRGRGRGLDIDLNEPRTSFYLDLNNPPPSEDDDET